MPDKTPGDNATDQYLDDANDFDNPLPSGEYAEFEPGISMHLASYRFDFSPFVPAGNIPEEEQVRLIDEFAQALAAEEDTHPSGYSFSLSWFHSRNKALLDRWWINMSEEMKQEMGRERPGMFIGLDEEYRVREPRDSKLQELIETTTGRLQEVLQPPYPARSGFGIYTWLTDHSEPQ